MRDDAWPSWLLKPSVISTMILRMAASLSLSPDLSSRAQGPQKIAEGERRFRILCAGVEAGADARRDEAIAARR
jgi:hypothetical protein